MNKQQIIDRITNDLIEEIKISEKNFSNEEIKEKINQKILDYTLNSEENLLQKEKLETEDLLLKNEFTKIDDDGGEENNDFDFEIEDNFDKDINEENGIIKEDVTNNKKFFQEVADIYKSEFKQSISCFSNVVDSMRLTSKTSLFELILVFLFLVIPAILAGCFAFLIVILLFIIWQIYLITKTIYKLLKKAEFSIKDTINNIKIKIKNYKKSGGFLKKLIFSNALYTLLMFNGVMYMIIKGMMLPVKSVLEVEKILANVIAKIEKGITTILKAPSELAAANTKSQNLKESKKSKAKSKEQINNKKLKSEIKKLNEKLNLKDKPQQKQEKVNEMAKALHQTKNVELANAIAKSLKQNLNKDILFANKVNNEEKIVTEVLKNKEIEKLAMNSEAKSMPDSNFLGNSRQEMQNAILDGIINGLAQIGKDITENSFNKDIISKNLNRSFNPDMERMLADARSEQIENQTEAQSAISKQNAIYGEDKVKEINAIYQHGGSLGNAIMQQPYVDLSTPQGMDDALNYAFHQADNNIAKSDIADAQKFEQYVKDNPNITMAEYREYKFNDAEKQELEERQTFKEIYGRDCQEMLMEAMQNHGYSLNVPLIDEQKMEICKDVARQSSDDPIKQINAMKDLAEFIEAFEEKMRCEKELSNEKPKFIDRLGEKSNSRGNEIGII